MFDFRRYCAVNIDWQEKLTFSQEKLTFSLYNIRESEFALTTKTYQTSQALKQCRIFSAVQQRWKYFPLNVSVVFTRNSWVLRLMCSIYIRSNNTKPYVPSPLLVTGLRPILISRLARERRRSLQNIHNYWEISLSAPQNWNLSQPHQILSVTLQYSIRTFPPVVPIVLSSLG